MDISKILDAQSLDKERLTLLMSIEKGEVKLELDKAKKVIEESKTSLLQLESDAKALQENFNRIEKVLCDTASSVENAKKSDSDIGEFGSFLSRLSILEGQLADIERRIAEKSAAFKNTMSSVIKATDFVKRTSNIFENQKQSIAGKITELDKSFEEKIKGVDEKLVAKYKSIRKQKSGDTKDVIVPLMDNRCYGCYMEVPMATVSKINTDGWAVCDECGRIIYKNDNAK